MIINRFMKPTSPSSASEEADRMNLRHSCLRPAIYNMAAVAEKKTARKRQLSYCAPFFLSVFPCENYK